MNRKHELVRVIVLALALAALFTPSASAEGRAPAAAGSYHTPSAIDRLLAQEKARGADLCAGLKTCVREFQPAAVTPKVTIVEPSAFDWGDAGVGAAGAFGLVLLAGGVLIVIRRDFLDRRRHG